jgi:hypothetical protein
MDQTFSRFCTDRDDALGCIAIWRAAQTRRLARAHNENLPDWRRANATQAAIDAQNRIDEIDAMMKLRGWL